MVGRRSWSRIATGAGAILIASSASAAALGDQSGSSVPGAPSSQRFGEFGRCPLAPAGRYLPHNAGCVSARRADVDGDGRTDLILLYARLDARQRATGFTLETITAGGKKLVAKVPRSGTNATITQVRNVNERRGVEIFVHEAHITTEERVGVYTIGGGKLRRAASFSYGGEDAGIRFGVTCHTQPPASIVQHRFQERAPFKGIWTETSTTYSWQGAHLQRGTSHTRTARPTAADVGIRC